MSYYLKAGPAAPGMEDWIPESPMSESDCIAMGSRYLKSYFWKVDGPLIYSLFNRWDKFPEPYFIVCPKE